MQSVLLIFPNQLFKDHKGFEFSPDRIILIEDSLFFQDNEYPVNFHKQKLVYHRASMKAYEQYIISLGYKTGYIEWCEQNLLLYLQSAQTQNLIVMEPVDQVLHKRIVSYCNQNNHTVQWVDSQLFINSDQENRHYSKSCTRWHMAKFYKHQRRRLDVLMKDGSPVGGKWSFDSENRKKIPINKRNQIPQLTLPESNRFVKEAKQYVQEQFHNSIGDDAVFYYPVTHKQADWWLQQFFEQRFAKFGVYEDALVPNENWLYHSVLSPLLNTGLLTADEIISAAVTYADKNAIPISSLEGFIRQIIGWREFMRATYSDLGTRMRTGNHWGHNTSMPECFYTANTGILPVDDVILRILKTGYCHHIERLMVLGGFMFLCEIKPDDIYEWFMAFFIDAYDWVMVPNVDGMSQNADGGLITTKPYFSGSAYLKKMGYNDTGGWCDIWDGLYWRWIWKNRDELKTNPRWAMMCSMVEKMDRGKLASHLDHAENYLKSTIQDGK